MMRLSNSKAIFGIQNYRAIVTMASRYVGKPLSSSNNFYKMKSVDLIRANKHHPVVALQNNLIIVRNSSSSKPPSNKIGLLTTLGVGASMLIGKTKYVLVALKLTKAAPLASMVLSSFAYSFIFGWPYAVGMVSLIFFHECGHAIVMNHYKVPFSPMVFLPFMGAVIAMKDEPRNAYEEAMIAFGGPLFGTVAAIGTGSLGVAYDSQLLMALADFGYMINLFNLMPIGSMDGGRIGNAISPWIGVAGLAGGGALIYHGAVHNPIFYLIMLAGTYTTTARVFGWEERSKDYYKIPRGKQAVVLGGYLGLIMTLLYAMNENNKYRRTPKQLEAQQRYKQLYGEEEAENPWSIGTVPGSSGGANEDGVYDDYFK